MPMPRVTTAEFIRRCRAKHGDRFDYSDTRYSVHRDPVTVFCKTHLRRIVVEARDHLRLASGGCPDCKHDGVALPAEKFIERATELHAGKYDYQRVSYQNLNDKVKIRCPTHGWFEQKASHHLSGHECEQCGIVRRGKSRRTNVGEQIIERFRKVHGEKYDYSQVLYGRFQKEVTIICPESGHGQFQMRPSVHLRGGGCQRCAGNFRFGQEGFIERAVEKHGAKYDYSRVDYVNIDVPVEILCPIHGIFTQIPYGHLAGSGCRECGPLPLPDTPKTISRFRDIHGDKYDYSLVEYRGRFRKVTIICPEHGPFEQVVANHLNGSGCDRCAQSGFDPKKPAILYYARINDVTYGPVWKIGITNRSFEDRYRLQDRETMTLLKTWSFPDGTDAKTREAEIMKKFREYRYTGPSLLVRTEIQTHREMFVRDVLGLDGHAYSVACLR